MTHKILVISETDSGFHDKLLYKTVESFVSQDCFWDTLRIPVNEVSIRSIVEHARFYAADCIHISRLLNPITLLEALNNPLGIGECPPISFLIFGLASELRDEKRMDALRKLSYAKEIKKIVMMSIEPLSLAGTAQLNGLNIDKISFLHEPPYETKEFYRNVSMTEARNRLKIGQDLKIALYFGTYFFSKGPDIALEAARLLPDIHFCFVGNMSLGSIEIKRDDYRDASNIHFWNEYVAEDVARDWFRAANVILLPYRKFYRFDSSGIFNQAMLAEKIAIVPNFAPFTLLANKFNVAGTFLAENPINLANRVASLISFDTTGLEFDKYLNQQNDWNAIAKEVLA